MVQSKLTLLALAGSALAGVIQREPESDVDRYDAGYSHITSLPAQITATSESYGKESSSSIPYLPELSGLPQEPPHSTYIPPVPTSEPHSPIISYPGEGEYAHTTEPIKPTSAPSSYEHPEPPHESSSVHPSSYPVKPTSWPLSYGVPPPSSSKPAEPEKPYETKPAPPPGSYQPPPTKQPSQPPHPSQPAEPTYTGPVHSEGPSPYHGVVPWEGCPAPTGYPSHYPQPEPVKTGASSAPAIPPAESSKPSQGQYKFPSAIPTPPTTSKSKLPSASGKPHTYGPPPSGHSSAAVAEKPQTSSKATEGPATTEIPNAKPSTVPLSSSASVAFETSAFISILSAVFAAFLFSVTL